MSGIASRLPVHVYPAISKAMQEEMSGYEEFINLASKDTLIFGYHKRLNEKKHAFVIIQSARYQGRFSAEVGLSRVGCYPYYLKDSPLKLGTFGFRKKACLLSDGTEFSLGYGINDMNAIAAKIVRNFAAPSVHVLLNSVDSDINMAESIWAPIFEDWQKAEKESVGKKLKDLFSDLQYADVCKKFFMENVFGKENKYLRFLGPLRNRYEKKRFFDCHLYLMAYSCEFLTPPADKNSSVNRQDADNAAADNKNSIIDLYGSLLGPKPIVEEKKAPEFNNQCPGLEDPVLAILKRQEQDRCVSLSCDPQQRKLEYAFLQSMSALEALSELYEI